MTGAGAASWVPREARSTPSLLAHQLCVPLHTHLSRQIQPCVSLSDGARGQASPQGGGCLQAQARLTESKAWEGDLCLKPGCSLSSVTLGTPQTQVALSPISRGRGSQAFSMGSRQGL